MSFSPSQLSGVLRAAVQSGPSNGAFAVMVVAPTWASGGAEMSLGLAKLAGQQMHKPVWLLDLDFKQSGLYHTLDASNEEGERPARAFSAALGTQPIYSPVGKRMIATRAGVEPLKLLTLHEVPGHNMFVSRFRSEAVVPGEQIALTRSPDWWQAARERAGAVIVHAPPLEHGGGALTFCRDMDGVIIVVDADRTAVDDVAAMKEEVDAQGGRVIGAVMTGVKGDVRLAARLGA